MSVFLVQIYKKNLTLYMYLIQFFFYIWQSRFGYHIINFVLSFKMSSHHPYINIILFYLYKIYYHCKNLPLFSIAFNKKCIIFKFTQIKTLLMIYKFLHVIYFTLFSSYRISNMGFYLCSTTKWGNTNRHF